MLFPSVQDKRPLLVEVQALVVPTRAPQPRRSFKGLEAARVHQILAVLEKHAGLSFSDREVYVSLAGGIKVKEPDVSVVLFPDVDETGDDRGGCPQTSPAFFSFIIFLTWGHSLPCGPRDYEVQPYFFVALTLQDT